MAAQTFKPVAPTNFVASKNLPGKQPRGMSSPQDFDKRTTATKPIRGNRGGFAGGKR